ncbi:MAG: nucleotidyltransferase domain-containing protein [Firmicutes bacterium]|nr:nucleotidyltransferase domain-containing protein [Bacillota bacterium]
MAVFGSAGRGTARPDSDVTSCSLRQTRGEENKQ